MHVMEIPGEKRDKGTEEIFEGIMKGSEFSKLNEIHQTTDPRRPEGTKEDKYQKINM